MNPTDVKFRGRILAGVSLAAGVLGFILRSAYFRTALDAKGFLIAWHPLQILFWVLAVLVFAAAVFSTRQLPRKEQELPSGTLPGAAQMIMGICLAFTVMQAPYHILLKLLGWAAAACLVADGVGSVLGKSRGFLSNGLLCIFLIIYLIKNYTVWSSVPQMELFLTGVLTLFCMTLFSYHMAVWSQTRKPSPRLLLLGMMGSFLGISTFGCPDRELLCVGGAVWMLLQLAAVQIEKDD